jgi:hypothetical protein
MHLRRFMLLCAGLVAIAAGSARACPDHAAKTAVTVTRRPASAAALVAWKPRAWAPASASGLRVSIDPVDGAYGMPAADPTPLVMVPAEDAPVAVTRRADGSVRAQLDERFADFAVVTLGSDGKPHWTCIHGSKEAGRFVRTPTPVVPPAPGTVWEEK